MEARFFDRRFILVVGKGGVGKSTVAAAMGLAFARRGRRTIIAELNTDNRIPTLFGKKPMGYQVQELDSGLYCMNIQPGPALEEYGLMKLKYRAAYRLVFENEIMRRLLRFIPGMNELLLLGKAWYLEQERDGRGRPVWDTVIVDAHATGHGLKLFQTPQTISSVIKSGPMAEDATKMMATLTDPAKTLLNIVTLPEEMPCVETEELYGQVRDQLMLPMGYLFINQVWPEILDSRERRILRTYEQSRSDEGSETEDEVLMCTRYMLSRRKLQEPYLRKLRARVALPQVEIPHLFDQDFDRETLGHVAELVEREIEKSPLTL